VTVASSTHLDERTEAFVADVLEAIGRHLAVAEAFVVGSGATGGFDPATSDVDLVVVVEHPPADQAALIADVTAIRSPVRDLELVLYVEGAQPPDYELNLNHGEERPSDEPFWFVLDGALAQEQAVPLLHGRAWSEFFDPVLPEQVREAMQASLDWTGRMKPDNEFAREQAVRARHYLDYGEWITKKEAQQ
jgi:predicted nucleotidyltransferase